MNTSTLNRATFKKSVTTSPYSCRFAGWDITVPAGSVVTNMTAMGCDDDYHFWKDFHATAKEVTGFESSMLSHDLDKYGLNVPAEYCAPYAS